MTSNERYHIYTHANTCKPTHSEVNHLSGAIRRVPRGCAWLLSTAFAFCTTPASAQTPRSPAAVAGDRVGYPPWNRASAPPPRSLVRSSAVPLGPTHPAIHRRRATSGLQANADSSVTPLFPRVAPDRSVVVVQPGDSLWGLAAKRVSSESAGAVAAATTALYRANKATIEDPDLIWPGQRLRIPRVIENS